MMNLEQEACSYRNFSYLLAGYRLSSALMMAHDAGVFDAIDQNGVEGSELCQRLGWDLAYGDRFLRCLCGLGLLRQHDGRYFLSPFAATYLCSLSGQYQGKTLAFEKQLYHSWEQLAITLETGKRVFATKDRRSWSRPFPPIWAVWTKRPVFAQRNSGIGFHFQRPVLRDDSYGGSVEKKYRFLGEVLDAVLDVWPSKRVGIRLYQQHCDSMQKWKRELVVTIDGLSECSPDRLFRRLSPLLAISYIISSR